MASDRSLSLAVVAARREWHDIRHDVDLAGDSVLPHAGGLGIAHVLVGQLYQEARPVHTCENMVSIR